MYFLPGQHLDYGMRRYNLLLGLAAITCTSMLCSEYICRTDHKKRLLLPKGIWQSVEQNNMHVSGDPLLIELYLASFLVWHEFTEDWER